MKSISEFLKILRCTCGADLNSIQKNIACSKCGQIYGSADNAYFNYTKEHKNKENVESNPDGLVARLKYFFKKFPKFYYFLAYLFGGRQVNTTAEKFCKTLRSDAVVVNVGSGTKRLGENVINVDFFPFSVVDVVTLAEQLPFKDGSVDAVVCDNLLEHVKKPLAVIREIHRVLKTGGIVYVGIPFMLGYHSSPNDFQRWTAEGLRELMFGFSERELKIAYGPTSAMVTVLSEWLALVFSFNISFLYNSLLIILTIILSPLKLLDCVVSHYKTAENIAYGFYYIGTKKSVNSSLCLSL